MKNYKWRGDIFSRNGVSQFTGWWFKESTPNVPIQVYDLPNNIPNNDTYMLAHVRLDGVKFDAIRGKFLQILGGQTHVKCENHRLPLIVFTMHMKKYKSVINEYLRCCEISCRVFMCKRYFGNLNYNTIIFVSYPDYDYYSESDIYPDSYSDSDSDDKILEPLISDDGLF